MWRGVLRGTSQGTFRENFTGNFSRELYGETSQRDLSEGLFGETFPSGRPVNHQW